MRSLAICSAALALLCSCGHIDSIKGTLFEVNPDKCSDFVIPNVVSNINVFTMGSTFIDPEIPLKNNIFDFVEYVQLMSATGGSASRDLFKNPEDFSVLDDYDFTNLIENCRGILALGAKPCIKTGSMPLKLSRKPSISKSFKVCEETAADFEEYYKYIHAIAEALAGEFGLEEVRSWHWGVFTEYENGCWFKPEGMTPEETAMEYFKIYDTTAAALVDVLGKDIYIGAHSMTNEDGLWDEAMFIRHCAETGAPLKYLSASFYNWFPWFEPKKALEDCIGYLKSTAEECGLKDLVFGIDEGRIGVSKAGADKNALKSRTVGYSYMGAFDVRHYKVLVDAGGSYLSSWAYLSEGLFKGNPSISYHAARKFHEFSGMKRIPVSNDEVIEADGSRSGIFAGLEGKTTKVAVYNFKYDLEAKDSLDITIRIKPLTKKRSHTISYWKLDDNCNWFDEWTKIREENGITDEMFSWSGDDACCLPDNIIDSTARQVYIDNLPLFKQSSKLVTIFKKYRTDKDGYLTIRCPMQTNTAWYLDIK